MGRRRDTSQIEAIDLTVVVVSWNTRDLLGRCLASIRDRLGRLDAEIVVVDNGSDDGSAELVAASFPDVVLIGNRENRGFGRAVNQAIRASRGRHVLLLNSDATLADAAAPRMVEYLDRYPRVAAVGGKLLNPDGSFQGSYADFPSLVSEMLLLTGLSRWLLPPTFPSHGEAESRERRTVDWVCGAFMMLRREALTSVGLLDEDYFMYAEELDWCRRARTRGWDVAYLPDAEATHVVAGSYVAGSHARAATRRRAHVYRGKCLYFRKHLGWPRAQLFYALVRAASGAKLAAWALGGASPDPARRERARRNVASYRYLLRQF